MGISINAWAFWKLSWPAMEGAGDFTGLDRLAVQRGDDAHHIRLDPLQQELVRVSMPVIEAPSPEMMTVNSAVLDPVGPGGEDREFARPFSPPLTRNFARVLEVVAIHGAPEDALRRNRFTVGGKDQGDFSLRHDCDRFFDDPELPRPISEIQAGDERRGLEAGFAVERDQTSRRQRPAGEPFHHDAHLPLADQHATSPEDEEGHEQGATERGGQDRVCQNYIRHHRTSPVLLVAPSAGCRRGSRNAFSYRETVVIPPSGILEDRPSRCRRG